VTAHIELGLGIIGLGKPWGHRPGEVPSEAEAVALLEYAYELGIRYFDSAPSYGVAEERLCKFVHSLTHAQRSGIRIATKFGEHWDAAKEAPFVDHSFDALRRSLDWSLKLLDRIDLLQLHKTTPEALGSRDLARAWEYAASLGIGTLGASVSDLESAAIVTGEPRYGCIQLPLNRENQKFSATVRAASARGMWVATNRPFAMGAMLYRDQPVSREEAFRFVLAHGFTGVVLTGTKSKEHLQQNWQAFGQASSSSSTSFDLLDAGQMRP
jgi:aryl-alcohol dehydrogenase-like predicted oxidoreductase